MNTELIEAIESLKSSVDKLTAIQTDHFNVETSNNDIASLKNRINDLIESNKELKQSIGYLNAAINDLADKISKK